MVYISGKAAIRTLSDTLWGRDGRMDALDQLFALFFAPTRCGELSSLSQHACYGEKRYQIACLRDFRSTDCTLDARRPPAMLGLFTARIGRGPNHRAEFKLDCLVHWNVRQPKNWDHRSMGMFFAWTHTEIRDQPHATGTSKTSERIDGRPR